jgi:hypothetical protein
MNSPIFIIGNPRSGTTLLRLMLTCHKNIVIPPECGFAVWFYDKYGRQGGWETDNFRLRQFLEDLFHARKIEHWELNKEDLFRFLKRRQPSSYSELVSLVYEYYGISRGRAFTRWGDKNNFYLHHILTIKAMFPDAHFVHIVRDGRDVACSYKKLGEKTIDSIYAPKLPVQIKDIAEQWSTNVDTAVQSFASMEWQKVCEIRFEDLILNPEPALRRLCSQLGEEYDPAMLGYYVKNREDQLEPKELIDWKEKNLKPPIRSEVGRYKRELSEQDSEVFEEIAGRELARYGYL